MSLPPLRLAPIGANATTVAKAEPTPTTLPQIHAREADTKVKKVVDARLERTAFDLGFLNPYFLNKAADCIQLSRHMHSRSLNAIKAIVDRFQQSQLKIILLEYTNGKMSSSELRQKTQEFSVNFNNLSKAEKADLQYRTAFLMKKLESSFKEKGITLTTEDTHSEPSEQTQLEQQIMLALLREYYMLYPNSKTYSNFLGHLNTSKET